MRRTLLFRREGKGSRRSGSDQSGAPSVAAAIHVPLATTPFQTVATNAAVPASVPVAHAILEHYTVAAAAPEPLVDPHTSDYALARYDFKMRGGTFLELEKGDYVAIISRDEEHYLTGRSLETGDFGSFPEKYVQLLTFGDLPASYQSYLLLKAREVFSTDKFNNLERSGTLRTGRLTPPPPNVAQLLVTPQQAVASAEEWAAAGLTVTSDPRMLTIASIASTAPSFSEYLSQAGQPGGVPVAVGTPFWQAATTAAPRPPAQPLNHRDVPTPDILSSSPVENDAQVTLSPSPVASGRPKSRASPQRQFVAQPFGPPADLAPQPESGRVSPTSPIKQAFSASAPVSPVHEAALSPLKTPDSPSMPPRLSIPPNASLPPVPGTGKSLHTPQSRASSPVFAPGAIPNGRQTSSLPAFSPQSPSSAALGSPHAQPVLNNTAARERLYNLHQVGNPLGNMNAFYSYRRDPNSFVSLDKSMQRLGNIDEPLLSPRLLMVKYILPYTGGASVAGPPPSAQGSLDGPYFSSGHDATSSPTLAFASKQIVDQLRGIFSWVSMHIAYAENPGHGDSAAEVLRTRRSGAEGFANLVERLCQTINVPCCKVTGYVRGSLEDIGDTDLVPTINHTWNVVFVHGMYFALDCGLASPTHPFNAQALSYTFYTMNKTSESYSLRVARHFTGSLTGMNMSRKTWTAAELLMTQRPNGFYFLADPDTLVWTHFPLTTVAYQRQNNAELHKLQFVTPPVSIKFFLNIPLTIAHNFWNWRAEGAEGAPRPLLSIMEPAGCVWNHSGYRNDGENSYGVLQAHVDQDYGVWCDIVPRKLFQAHLQDYLRGANSAMVNMAGMGQSRALVANSARRVGTRASSAVDAVSDQVAEGASASQSRRRFMVQYIYDSIRRRRLVDVRAFAQAGELVCISVGRRVTENALNVNPYRLALVYSGESVQAAAESEPVAEAPLLAQYTPDNMVTLVPQMALPRVNVLRDEFAHVMITPNEFYIEQPFHYYLTLGATYHFVLHDTTFALHMQKAQSALDQQHRARAADTATIRLPPPLRVALKLNGARNVVDLEPQTRLVESEQPRDVHFRDNGLSSPIPANFSAPAHYTRVYTAQVTISCAGPVALVYHDGSVWQIIAEYQAIYGL